MEKNEALYTVLKSLEDSGPLLGPFPLRCPSDAAQSFIL